jgi:hypothetical protein
MTKTAEPLYEYACHEEITGWLGFPAGRALRRRWRQAEQKQGVDGVLILDRWLVIL